MLAGQIVPGEQRKWDAGWRPDGPGSRAWKRLSSCRSKSLTSVLYPCLPHILAAGLGGGVFYKLGAMSELEYARVQTLSALVGGSPGHVLEGRVVSEGGAEPETQWPLSQSAQVQMGRLIWSPCSQQVYSAMWLSTPVSRSPWRNGCQPAGPCPKPWDISLFS